VTKSFLFDAAHTLTRSVDTEPSRRIHGHSYRAEVTLTGVPDVESGMVVDFGALEVLLRDARDGLDHRFLDEVPDLGPATMENICFWIWARLEPALPALSSVTVRRDSSGESCRYTGHRAAAS
jgi:6-pyruvoyltetrahydropterin/6-carboxytetrahydropterin synthase